MSLLLKNSFPSRILKLSRAIHLTQTKNDHWLPYYKPGPYPKTQEEREAAAKKYNLLPEEYEPYPDEGLGCGDYPKLPFESVDSKDPYCNWDHPHLRRDYLEPVPFEFMILLPEYLSTGPRPMSPYKEFAIYVAAISFTGLVVYILSHFELRAPVSEKQYPNAGPHYTFELEKPEEDKMNEKNKVKAK